MTKLAVTPANRLNEIDPSSDESFLLFDESAAATKAWIEKYLTVQNEHGQIVPMKLFPQQVMMLEDETGRDVIIKSRQTRASSLWMAAFTRRLTSGQLWGATAVVGAQDDQTTQGGFRKRFEHHLADLARAGFNYKVRSNEQELVIEDLGNRIVWISGEQRTMSRGYAVQLLHLSELAHWGKQALELIGGALPAVPSSGHIIFESTPRGEVGAFYEYAMKLSKPNNPKGLWTSHLYPWWLEPRYRVGDNPATGFDIILAKTDLQELVQNFIPSEYEVRLQQRYNLSIWQVLWRRLKKIELDATHAPFLQEYPEDSDTCWLGMEGKFFDTPDGIDHLEFYRDSRQEPLRRYEKLTYRGAEVGFYGPNFAIWEFPDSADTYVVGFDTAGGGIGDNSDYSVAYIFSVRKEKIVARLRVQASPKVFAAMLCAISNFFHEATVNGERSHQGDMVFEEMRDLGYKNIYYHFDPTKPKDTPKAGIYTSQANRQMILEKLKSGIVGGAITSFCSELVREMNIFTWIKYNGRMKVSAMDLVGQHDDCIFAAAEGWYIIDKVRNRIRPPQDVNYPDGVGDVYTGGASRGRREVPYNQQVWFT